MKTHGKKNHHIRLRHTDCITKPRLFFVYEPKQRFVTFSHPSTFQAIRRDVLSHQPTYEFIEAEGDKALTAAKSGPQREELEQKLEEVKKRWKNLTEHTDQRRVQLEEVLPLAQKYHDALKNVESVVTRAETQLESFSGPVIDPDRAKQQLGDIKVSLKSIIFEVVYG